MLGVHSTDTTAENNIRNAISNIGTVGEVSINKLKTQLAKIMAILMRDVWNPNAVPLRIYISYKIYRT